MKKLLLIGPGSVHTYNYYKLIDRFFDEMLLITNISRPEFDSVRTVRSDFSIRNPFQAIKNIRVIRRHIKKFKPDVIHVHQANSIAYLSIRANKNTGIPVIVTAWGSDVLIAPERGILIKKMIIYNLKSATYLTADSQYVAQRIVELAKRIKHEVIVANFGIEDFYKKGPKETIIYSNRLHKKLYRIDYIISSFNLFIRKKNENWKLIIAGDGEETENLKLLVQRLNIDDRVEFTGWLDENSNYELYNKAKIFVSIPESDATAISLLEAMSAECIPVVSDLPANREWIQHGTNGIVVNNLNEDFFSMALGLDPKKVSQINRELISLHATKAVNRNKFIDLYKKTIQE